MAVKRRLQKESNAHCDTKEKPLLSEKHVKLAWGGLVKMFTTIGTKLFLITSALFRHRFLYEKLDLWMEIRLFDPLLDTP